MFEYNYSSSFLTTTTSKSCPNWTSITHTYPFLIVVNFQTVLSIVFLIIYPFQTALVFISAIGFLLLGKWTNPLKIYYYLISIFNILEFIFQDLTWTLVNLLGILSGNVITGLYVPNFMYPLMNSNGVICSLFYFLRDIGLACQIWTVCILGIQRMLIVIFPLKAKLFKNFKWILSLVVILIGCLYIPDFFIVQIRLGVSCTNMAAINSAAFAFWNLYYGQLIYVVNIVPILIMCSSLVVTLHHIIKAAKERVKFTSSEAPKRKTYLEQRSIVISISFNVIYIIGIGPYACISIIMSYLRGTDCNSWSFLVWFWLQTINSALSFEPMLLRLGDGLIFLLMIPELRRSVFNLLRCHKFK